MADNKRYYYLKLKDNFFDTEEIKVLENMPNGIYYSNLLIKLYLKSLKFNGALRFNDCIPYDENMIAAITNLNIDTVRSGLQVLASMKLIERLDDGTIYLMNIQSFIGKSSSEADRKKIYRAKIEEEKLLLEQKSKIEYEEVSAGNTDIIGFDDETFMELYTEDTETKRGTISDKRPPEIRDKEIKDKENKDKEFRDIEIRDEEKEEFDIDDKETGCKDEKEIVSRSIEIINYFEEATGLPGGLNFGAVKTVVSIHGGDYVKKAVDIALDRNKPTMIYINGILKNWAKEGYPKGGEGNGNRSFSKNNDSCTNEFTGFKPKQPRTITEEERRSIEGELI